MSQLNLTRKTFLEKEELNRFQSFLEYNATRHVTLSNTTSWGIVRSNFSGEDLNFKVEVGSNIGTIKINKDFSYALDKDGLLIVLPQTLNYPIPNDSVWRWLFISHQYRRFEEGYVNVDNVGNISGTNTKFSQTLRGQSTEVPIKIRFVRDDGGTLVNTGTYEIIDVGGDIICTATSATGFVAESNLRMIVIGSTPIGENITNEQLEGLYKYDGCKLELKPDGPGGSPSGHTYNKEFYIARVRNVGGAITIQDYRQKYWASNVPGVDDRLSKFENLNDLEDKVEARSNLDVYSTAEADALFGGSTDLTPYLRKDDNLNSVTDKTTARSNLGVYNTTTVDDKDALRALKTNVIEKDSIDTYYPTALTHPVNVNFIVSNFKSGILGYGSPPTGTATVYLDEEIDNIDYSVVLTFVNNGTYTTTPSLRVENQTTTSFDVVVGSTSGNGACSVNWLLMVNVLI